jgi:hypothetical protein
LRFHRGAFYLAEALQLDVVPVVLHGVGHVLPKGELVLRNGAITMQVHPRIAPGDTRYGEGYAARTKQLRQRYRENLEELSRRIETAAYFRSFLLHSYLYKGAALERSVRREVKTTGCYAQWIDVHTGAGVTLVVNSGNGVFAFLFALVHRHVQVVAIDGDEDKVALTRSCTGIPCNLTVYGEDELPAGMNFETVYLLNPTEAQREKYRSYNLKIVEVDG